MTNHRRRGAAGPVAPQDLDRLIEAERSLASRLQQARDEAAALVAAAREEALARRRAVADAAAARRREAEREVARTREQRLREIAGEWQRRAACLEQVSKPRQAELADRLIRQVLAGSAGREAPP